MADARPRKKGWKQTLRHELRKTLLVVLYFLVGFNLLALEVQLLAPGVRTPTELFGGATVMALVLGKVMVVADGLLRRFVRRTGSFGQAVFLKSLLFTMAMFVALATEEVLHAMLSLDLSVGEAVHHALAEATGARFLARFVYLMVLFVLYSFVFELEPYFRPRSLSDVVLSRFADAQESDSVAMRIGFVQPLDFEAASERVRFTRGLYEAVRDAAEAQGAHLEVFGGAFAFVVWPDARDFEPEQATLVYEAYKRRVDAALSDWALRQQRALEVKGVVARGQMLTFEVGSLEQREIVRQGDVLDRVGRVFEAQEAKGLRFEGGLG